MDMVSMFRRFNLHFLEMKPSRNEREATGKNWGSIDIRGARLGEGLLNSFHAWIPNCPNFDCQTRAIGITDNSSRKNPPPVTDVCGPFDFRGILGQGSGADRLSTVGCGGGDTDPQCEVGAQMPVYMRWLEASCNKS